LGILGRNTGFDLIIQPIKLQHTQDGQECAEKVGEETRFGILGAGYNIQPITEECIPVNLDESTNAVEVRLKLETAAGRNQEFRLVLSLDEDGQFSMVDAEEIEKPAN
jgi:hypothetical protein